MSNNEANLMVLGGKNAVTIVREPVGPDGTKGFKVVRQPPKLIRTWCCHGAIIVWVFVVESTLKISTRPSRLIFTPFVLSRLSFDNCVKGINKSIMDSTAVEFCRYFYCLFKLSGYGTNFYFSKIFLFCFDWINFRIVGAYTEYSGSQWKHWNLKQSKPAIM